MVKESTVRNNGSLRIGEIYREIPSQFICLIYLTVGILISAAELNGKCFPAGVAYVGALGGGLFGAVGLVGVCIGYLLFYGFDLTVLLISAALFTYTIAFLFQYTALNHSKVFMSFIVFTLISLIRAFGSVNIIRGTSILASEWCMEALLGGALTYLYRPALRESKIVCTFPLHSYSVCALIATCLMSVPSINLIADISFSNIIALVVITFIIYRGKLQVYPIAAMFGAAIEFGCVARQGALGAFLFFALADVFDFQKSKSRLILYMFGVFLVSALLTGASGQALSQIIESTIAAVLFLCLSSLRFSPPISKTETKIDINAHMYSRIYGLSQIMELIINTVTSSIEKLESDTEKDLIYVFDCAAEQVCGTCEKRMLCWEQQCLDPVTAFNGTTEKIMKRGKLVLGDFPDYFKLHCDRLDSLIIAVNYELRRCMEARKNREYELNVLESSIHNFRLFSEILSKIAKLYQLNQPIVDLSNERFTAEIGIASKRKKGESVCGDSTQSFRTRDGILYVVLSDGIGSGRYAHKHSAYIVSFLESYLSYLDDPSSAIALLDSALRLQDNEAWGSATIDLLAVNLITGEASFYKMGAADSHILMDEKIVVVEGDIHLVGARSNPFPLPHKTIQLKENAIIVMASDGVALTDSFLDEHIAAVNQNSMKGTARKLLLCSDKDIADDKTVITLRLYKRENDV